MMTANRKAPESFSYSTKEGRNIGLCQQNVLGFTETFREGHQATFTCNHMIIGEKDTFPEVWGLKNSLQQDLGMMTSGKNGKIY